MSVFYVNLTATNPKEEDKQTLPVQAMVDTGSELSWMPKQLLSDIGIESRGRKPFQTANGDIMERDYGYAILSAEGYSTIDDVVFAEEGDLTLLGVRTIEGFSVIVDNIGHRFISTASIAPMIRIVR